MRALLLAFFALTAVVAGGVGWAMARSDRPVSEYMPLLVTAVVLPVLILVFPRLTMMLRGRTQGARGLRLLALIFLVLPLVRVDELASGPAIVGGLWCATLAYVTVLWAMLDRQRPWTPAPRTMPGIRDEDSPHDASGAGLGSPFWGASGWIAGGSAGSYVGGGGWGDFGGGDSGGGDGGGGGGYGGGGDGGGGES